MLETFIAAAATLALALATVSLMRANALGSALDELGDELDALDALPGEVHELTERANRVLARLNARARRAAAAEGDDEEEGDDEPRQGELVHRAPAPDPVSARILALRERTTAARKDG